jgi:hypothetical protein
MRAWRWSELLRLGRRRLPLGHEPNVILLAGACLILAVSGTVAVDRLWLDPEFWFRPPPSPFTDERLRLMSEWEQLTGPTVGDEAPDFALPDLTGRGLVQLSSFRGHTPVVLVFGSFT